MKYYLTTLLIIVLGVSFGQTVNCERFKKGKFVIPNEVFGDTFIRRNSKFQIEKGKDPETRENYRTKSRVIWTDDCTCEFRPIKIKDPKNIITDEALIFKFVETSDDYYVVNVSGIGDYSMNVKVLVKN